MCASQLWDKPSGGGGDYQLVTVCTHGKYGQCCLTGTPGRQHHDLLSYSVALSWHWANQSFPYPNNAKHQAREQQVSILKSLVWFDQGSKTARFRLEHATFGFPELPEWEAGITHLAIPIGTAFFFLFISFKCFHQREAALPIGWIHSAQAHKGAVPWIWVLT